MLIPRDLYDLCSSGRAFRLLVTTDSGLTITFSRKRTIPLVNVPLIDVNGKEAENHEVETRFQQVEAMTERERDVSGVRLRPKQGLLLVSVAGRFAKTFDAKSHASQTATAYCPKDGIRGSNRAYFIKRTGCDRQSCNTKQLTPAPTDSERQPNADDQRPGLEGASD